MLRGSSLSPLALLLLVAGCGAPAEPTADPKRIPGRAGLANATCAFDVHGDITALKAHADGVALARHGVVHRMRGAGCDLAPFGAPVAAHALLDVDDAGALYVFPAEPAADAGDGQGHISTMLEGARADSIVARVEPDASSIAEVTELVYAGRGIWDFAIAPGGDALWVTACGPTGVFDVTPPSTIAQSPLQAPTNAMGAIPVFTNADTIWSVGPWTCDPAVHAPNDPAQLTDACGYALVRTTMEGSAEVASTTLDFGNGVGFERGAIARCGANVCGVFASGVVVWNDDGSIQTTLTHVELDVWRGESIAGVTGNAHGLYVLLKKNGAARVVFVPR